MKKCPRCGAENPDDKKWCKSCMKPLQDNPAAESDHDKTAEESRLSGSMGNKTYRKPDEQKTAGDKTQSHVSGFAHSDIPEDTDAPNEAKNSRLTGSIGRKRYEYKKTNEETKHENESVTFGGDPHDRFCTKCGNTIEKDALFCTRCGKPIATDFAESMYDAPHSHKVYRQILICIAISLVIILAGFIGVYFTRSCNNTHTSPPIVQSVDSKYGEHIYDNGDVTFTPGEENISYEKASGTIYFNNLLAVYTFDNLSASDAQKLADMVKGSVVGKINGSINMLQIMVRESSLEELISMAEILMSDSRVLYASYDYPVELTESGLDSNPWSNNNVPENDRGNEYHPDGNDWWAEAIGAYTSWSYENYCTPIKVGIIDSGFWDQHDDLLGKISFLPSYAINSEANHGTHVAGVIAAQNNNIGIRGIADEASLVCVDWSPTDNTSYLSSGDYSRIIKQMIENGVKVINNSWGVHFQSEGGYTNGVPSFVFNLFNESYDTYVKQVEAYSKQTAQTCIVLLIELLLNDKEDFLIIQAAGNGYDNYGPGADARYSCYFCGIDEDCFNSLLMESTRQNLLAQESISYTDIKDRVIIVGAVDNTTDRYGNYQMSYFSNFGETIDICAPGRDVYSTVNNRTGWFVKKNNYEYKNDSGTSMAAPIVAGSAAQVWSIDPTLSAGEVKASLINNALYQAYDPESNCTYPMLNLGNAVESLDKDIGGALQETVKTISSERNIVLVLDTSGSMSGTPIAETKKAATSFIDTTLQEDANIGIVTYDSSAYIASDFSTDANALIETVEDIYTGGGTNIDDGLSTAYSMLQSTNAKKKIIVLMSDGMPNEGREGDSLIAYADELKEEGILIYTLGFFGDLGGEKVSAQALMEGIASDGCHYEVASADDLVFFFEDMADQINGQRYIYIRIACPVDVYVSFNGEVLSSAERNQNLRTDFGTLSFEENEDGSPDPVKILRLKESVGYDVKIFGTGYGSMDYTIGFMDEIGEYTDLRMFRNIQITNQTVIDTIAAASDETVLNVDSDGDGKYDVKYRAEAYGYGKEVKVSIWLYIGVAAAIVVILYFALAYITNKRKTV